MRVFLHDYGGYAFSAQLGRELARRGHEVCYAYGEATQALKRGTLDKTTADPDHFEIVGIQLKRPFKKYAFLNRWLQEREYGRHLVDAMRRFQPQIVISANAPLDTQAIILRATRQARLPFVFWLQDLIGTATKEILKTKLPGVGHLAGTYYTRLEERMLRQSEHIILITPDFEPLLADWGIAADCFSVIPNWAVLDEIPVMPKDNAWAQEHDLADKFCFLFTGVLGMKHNPGLLLELAQHFESRPDVHVVVVSEGIGADWLRERVQAQTVSNLMVHDFEPVERYAEVLASGDVLMTILQPEAGIYSVPSKVLSYLCAQRSLLLAIPAANLAARIVRQHQAGVVVSPTEFVQAAQMLYNDETLRNTQAAHGRAYAEQHFNIETICDKFENILSQL